MFDFRNVSVNGLANLGSGISGSEEIINKWNEMLGSITSLNSLGWVTLTLARSFARRKNPQHASVSRSTPMLSQAGSAQASERQSLYRESQRERILFGVVAASNSDRPSLVLGQIRSGAESLGILKVAPLTMSEIPCGGLAASVRGNQKFVCRRPACWKLIEPLPVRRSTRVAVHVSSLDCVAAAAVANQWGSAAMGNT